MIEEPHAPTSEAYRLLRTSVRFLGIDSPLRTILVTSAAASEGKTVTAANLAATLAQTGERVLLISADLRRPRLHELFGAPMSPGLTTVLLGDTGLEAAVYTVEEVPGLHLLPPGSPPPNPAELLDSVRGREVLASYAERYDVGGRRLPAGAPGHRRRPSCREQADAVLLVVAYRSTSRRSLARTVEVLHQVDAPLVGTVVNRVPADEGYGGQGYRYDTYRSRGERRRVKRAAARGTSPSAKAHARHLSHEPADAARGSAAPPDAGSPRPEARRPGGGTCRALRCHSGERSHGGIDGRSPASGSARRQRHRWPGPRVRAGQRRTRRGDSARGRLSVAATAAARS